MLPIAAGAITAAKTAGASELIGKVSEGVTGLFGKTATDRAREAEVAGWLSRAMAGDRAAVEHMLRTAFTPGRPAAVDRLYKNALREYYRANPWDSPPAQYAAELGLPPSPTAKPLEGVLRPVITQATDVALERVQERGQTAVRQVAPYIIGGVTVLAALIYWTRK